MQIGPTPRSFLPYPNVGEGWNGLSTDDLKKLVICTRTWKSARADGEHTQMKDTRERSHRDHDNRAVPGSPLVRNSTNHHSQGGKEAYHNECPSRSYYDFCKTDHSNNGSRRNRDEYKHSCGEGCSCGQAGGTRCLVEITHIQLPKAYYLKCINPQTCLQ